MFKKTCYSCGSKVDKLYEKLCEECFRVQNPPIKEFKELNFKVCNSCRKIHYSNTLYELEEIEKDLPRIVEKRIVIEDHYKLNSVKIKNLEFEGSKLNFEVEVDCDLIDSIA